MIKPSMYCFDFSLEECPDGNSGVNCTKTCQTNCTIDQLCDMVDGCLQTEKNTEDEHSVSSETTTGYNTFVHIKLGIVHFFLATSIQHVLL